MKCSQGWQGYINVPCLTFEDKPSTPAKTGCSLLCQANEATGAAAPVVNHRPGEARTTAHVVLCRQ